VITATGPSVDPAAIPGAALSAADMGPDWAEQKSASVNTVQIGGTIGASNIVNPLAQASSAFTQKDSARTLSDSVFLTATPALARSIITAHVQAAQTASWTQTRAEGGSVNWKISGTPAGLDPPLGDQMFATKLHAAITDAKGRKADRNVEYVVFRFGRIVAFVVTQETAVAPFAHKQAAKVERIALG
jgi:hypothetical protein